MQIVTVLSSELNNVIKNQKGCICGLDCAHNNKETEKEFMYEQEIKMIMKNEKGALWLMFYRIQTDKMHRLICRITSSWLLGGKEA